MSALDDYMSKDDNTWEEYEAARAELAQLRDEVDELRAKVEYLQKYAKTLLEIIGRL